MNGWSTDHTIWQARPMAHLDHDKIVRTAGAVFDSHHRLGRAPAMVAAVVADGQCIGVLENGASIDTVFRIASMTKSFTAAAVMVLRDDGALRLDDPIGDLCPALGGVQGPTGDSPPITVRHLLTMSSGLCTDDPWGDRHLDIAADDLLALAPELLFSHAPGIEFEYSNTGYALIGQVVEAVTGQRLQDVVTQRLLAPLGMHDTVWSPDQLPAETQVAHGFARDGETVTQLEPLGDGAIAPMGGLWTTARDLAKWVAFMLDAFPARDGDDSTILRRSSRREMQQQHRAFSVEQSTYLDGRVGAAAGGYGFGLQRLVHPSVGSVVTHSGGLPGYGSNMRWAPGTGIGLVALANVTYAWMAAATSAAFDALAAAQVIPLPAPPLAPSLDVAATALLAFINDDDRSGFADNVNADRSFEDRGREAAELVAAHGRLRRGYLTVDSRTEATLVAFTESAVVNIGFTLAPVGSIQAYDIELVTAPRHD
jgi:CubicO group peptidase (beta-lactamase class C family)